MMKNSRINTSALFTEISRALASSEQGEQAHRRKNQTIKYDDNDMPEEDTAQQWEKRRIISALKNNGLSRKKAAHELGISRSTLWNKMKYYKIEL